MNGDLVNNKKSTVIELGTCIVNVLCQFGVKYYTFKALIAEYRFNVELKNHPFRTHVYMNFVLVLL